MANTKITTNVIADDAITTAKIADDAVGNDQLASGLTLGGNTAATLSTAAQPNITSVGTLTSLTVSGNLNATLTTAAQTNITSVGTLTSLTTSGSVTSNAVGNLFTHGTSWGTNLTLTNTNDDISPPVLTFQKSPTSGYTTMADNDYVGFINFRANNSANQAHSWVEISAFANDVTDGSEDSSLRIGTWGDGTEYANTLMLKSGNVGIGTASPAKRLHIFDATQTNQSVRLGNPAAAPYGEINFNSTGMEHLYIDSHGTTTGYGNIVFRTGATPDTRMFIHADGNVGIGTAGSSPLMKLHVKGATGDVPSNDSNPPSNGIAIFDSGGGYSLVIGTDDSNTGSAWIQSQSANVSSSEYDLLLNPNGGDVGIGTTNPLKKLDIVGGGYDQIMIRSAGGNNTNRLAGIAGIDYTGNQFSILQNFAQSGSQITYYGSADGSFRGVQGHQFMVNASATATSSHSVALLINSSAQLVVSRTGTNTPYASGLITFRPTSAFNTQVFLNPSTSAQNHSLFYNSSGTLIGYIQSSNSGTEFNTTSDYRLKKNIKSLSNQIEEVKKLKPVEFDWTFEESSSVGFIAHELQEVFPHAVSGEKDGVGLDGEMFPQGVDYGRITPLLTAALQEAITRIETLESEVEALKEKLNG